MRIRLLTTMKAGEKMIAPCVYDTQSDNFPEELYGESRFGVIEFLDNGGWETAPVSGENEIKSEESEETAEEEVEESPVGKKLKRRNK